MTELEPTGRARTDIEAEAESLARNLDFLPGDRIEPLVKRMGGEVVYLRDTFRGPSFITLGPGRFQVRVPAVNVGRAIIAHELGHYALHSSYGSRRVQAPRYGLSRAEWEANWFASALLMPANDFRSMWERLQGNSKKVGAHYLVLPWIAELRWQWLTYSSPSTSAAM